MNSERRKWVAMGAAGGSILTCASLVVVSILGEQLGIIPPILGKDNPSEPRSSQPTQTPASVCILETPLTETLDSTLTPISTLTPVICIPASVTPTRLVTPTMPRRENPPLIIDTDLPPPPEPTTIPTQPTQEPTQDLPPTNIATQPAP